MDDLIRPANKTSENRGRPLRAVTPFYTVAQDRHSRAVLTTKPEQLRHLATIDKKIWEQYQTYLSRTTALERAELYDRQLRERRLSSASALAHALGEERHVVRRYLRLLELAEPIRTYLHTHRTPALVRFFSEARLRELVRIADAKSAWRRFGELVAEAQREAGVWRRP